MRPPSLHALACAFALGCGIVHAQPGPDAGKPVTVQAPHHGAVLFNFYQSKIFSATTGLMTSQHFDRLRPHDDDAEVLRGGMLLSWGMHREAEAVFTRLIDRTVTPAVRDRAWFFLAKLRFQRGLEGDAQAALDRIGDALPADLADDRALLRAYMLMARGEDAAAAEGLRALVPLADAGKPGATAPSPYLRFNLGVALVRAGDALAGRALLESLGTAPAADEEARSLRDQANVALGFAALKDGRHDDARAALERVRLHGLHSNKALLGFGWAAASAKDHEAALVPWRELAARESSDAGGAAVLEARLAVPFALAELGARAQAMRGYEDALASFDAEHAALETSIDHVRRDGFLAALSRDGDRDGLEMGWLWQVRSLPELPHRGHLATVIAGHEFQEAYKTWRDLGFLEANLDEWAGKLASFADMLAVRRKAYADALPGVRKQASGIDLDALAKRRDALTAEVQRVQDATDVQALADADDRALLDRIAQARRTVDALSTTDAEHARERLRLAEGAMQWRMTQAWPLRLWALRKAMATIEREFEQARARDAALAQAQRVEPARFDAFAQRIAALDARLKALIPQVAALRGQQRQATQAVAVRALEAEQQRLAIYARQARYAIAQLYDQAAVAANRKDGDGAAR